MKSTRRGFIQQGTAMVAATSAPWLANLSAITDAAAATSGLTDYKALVCIFMLGGNDYANTLIPSDATSYAEYVKQRKNLYHRTDSLLMGEQATAMPVGYRPPGATAIRVMNDMRLTEPRLANMGREFALAPPLTELYDLYASGKMAVLLNVGTLHEPTVAIKTSTGLSYRKAGNPSDTTAPKIPARLFSHNDQVLTWQSSSPEGATIGWGGRIGDQLGINNQLGAFTCVSVSGNTVLLTGTNTVPYQVTGQQSLSISLKALRSPQYGSTAVSNALGQIVTGAGVVSTSSHVFEQDLVAVFKRSIAADDVLRTIPRQGGDATYAKLDALIDGVPQGEYNRLADELRTVAHLIRKATTSPGTGAKRQVFYVTIEGFDNHSDQIKNHPRLLQQVSQAVAAFQATLEGPNINAGNKVTTFTASDFGRTLNSNNDGTDHGWGSHHFIVGGAVNGGHIYGRPPVFGDGRTTTDRISGYEVYEDTGRGSLIPSTSVDQYAATLARWMGVPDAVLPQVVPNITKYNLTDWKANLGFMKA